MISVVIERERKLLEYLEEYKKGKITEEDIMHGEFLTSAEKEFLLSKRLADYEASLRDPEFVSKTMKKRDPIDLEQIVRTWGERLISAHLAESA